jgi:uncharacterized protein YgiM (DUF1202 family)
MRLFIHQTGETRLPVKSPSFTLLILFCFLLPQCSLPSPAPDSDNGSESPEPEGAALLFEEGEEVYVSVPSLRMRDAPSVEGRVVGSLSRGDSTEIVERSGEWLEVIRNTQRVWISAKHVSSARKTTKQVTPSQQSTYPNDSSTSHSWFGKRCKKGKPCGNACIAANRTCHK